MKRKMKWKNVILCLIILILIITFIISLYKIILWHLDNIDIKKQIDIIDDKIKITEMIDDEQTKIVDQEKEQNNDYWSYIKMNLIDVNFADLKTINNDTIGWIQVLGTNINYPVVKYRDNSYYLTHSFNKKHNSAGWVFMDYRNSPLNEKNTIIYAHGRIDKTMFGSLKNILTSGWLNNPQNHVVRLVTDKYTTLWQVFSVYRIPTTNDYLQTTFSTDERYLLFLNTLKSRSSYDFNTSLTSSDKILTLSTCYNNKEKVVLHAKLIKYANIEG